MNDERLLNNFRDGIIMQIEDIKRRLILCERSYYPEINDNLLQKAADYYLREVSCHAELFTKGLTLFADELLTQEPEETPFHIRVKPDSLSAWHEALTYCSPLLLIAAYSAKPGVRTIDDGIKYTALIPPKSRVNLIGNDPLYDLHMHLNGSTELDVLWQDALMFPEKYRQFFNCALKNELVKEQVEQTYSRPMDSTVLFQMLQEARSIRWYMINHLLDSNGQTTKNTNCDPSKDFAKYQTKNVHPLEENSKLIDSVPCSGDHGTLLEHEYWMYYLIFKYLCDDESAYGKARLVKWFHRYLLILGFMNRMIVQQSNQFGFRQFQKITVNELRSNSEEEYAARYRQLLSIDGNLGNRHVERLEGRLAPKDNPLADYKLIRRIDSGMQNCKITNNDNILALTVHFIKQKLNSHDQLRYDKYRRSIWIKSIALDSVLKDKYLRDSLHLKDHPIVAIDAAASEFDTPPEVFAPCFRYLRRAHPNLQLAYHAGEDYSHPLSGLRAIYEAITFLSLKKYDRIGHATALGIDPELWFSRMRHSFFLSREEWIDDLVFCMFILKLRDSPLKKKITQELSRINKCSVSIDILTQAWLARHWDPDCLSSSSFKDLSYYKCDEFRQYKSQNEEPQGDALKELKKHWQMSYYKDFQEPVLVDSSIITPEVIRMVQAELMKIVCSKGIYLESLPTSNLRISVYKEYAEHHIKNWIKGDAIQEQPRVVLGTDDTGIFATNIVYEYAHVAQLYDDTSRKNVIDKILKDSRSLVNDQENRNS